MVKVNAPMLSLDASGSIAGAMVYSKWKGRNYVRALVVPANPKSAPQVGVRSMFKFLAQNWTNLSASQKSTWDTLADEKVISPFNGFVGYNQDRWRNFLGPCTNHADFDDINPGVYGAASATAGVRQITISKALTTQNNAYVLIIHRNTTTGFTPTFANCVAVILTQAVDTFTWVDTPLVAGTYYYNFSKGTVGGERIAEDDEVSDTVV